MLGTWHSRILSSTDQHMGYKSLIKANFRVSLSSGHRKLYTLREGNRQFILLKRNMRSRVHFRVLHSCCFPTEEYSPDANLFVHANQILLTELNWEALECRVLCIHRCCIHIFSSFKWSYFHRKKGSIGCILKDLCMHKQLLNKGDGRLKTKTS